MSNFYDSFSIFIYFIIYMTSTFIFHFINPTNLPDFPIISAFCWFYPEKFMVKLPLENI